MDKEKEIREYIDQTREALRELEIATFGQTFYAKVEADDCACNPAKEWDMVGILAMPSGEEHNFMANKIMSADVLIDLMGEIESNPDMVGFQVNCYEHSGVALSLADLGNPANGWDNRPFGVWYTTKERYAKLCGLEWGNAPESLEAEFKVLEQYAAGEVYRITVENEQGEQVDSLSGLYGEEDAKAYLLMDMDFDYKEGDKLEISYIWGYTGETDHYTYKGGKWVED